MTPLRITGGQVLLPADGVQPIDVTLAGGRIDRLGGVARGGTPLAGGLRLDAGGLLVLPGIVDIHGDAFERQVQPRPGVDFPADIALADTESQLLANGITTAFHGITLSWEPGLRSVDPVAPAAGRAWRAHMDLRHAGAPAMGGVQPRRAGHRAGRYRRRAGAPGGVQRPYALDPEEDGRPGRQRQIQRPRRHDAGRLPRAGRAHRRTRRRGPGGVGAHRCRGARRRRRAGQPRRRDDRDAAGISRPRRAHLRVPDGRGGRRARARGRRLGGDGLPERGARRLASGLGLGGAAGGGGHLLRSVVGLLSIPQCCAPR